MSSFIELKAQIDLLESLVTDESLAADKGSMNSKIKELKLKIADIALANATVKVEPGCHFDYKKPSL